METTTPNPRLMNRDYTVIMDRSGSMTTTDCPNGKSRWAYAKESTGAVARYCNQFDPDGITLVTFAGNYETKENVGADDVAAIFDKTTPMGSTDLAGVLKGRFDHYIALKKKGEAKPNGEILLVVTDGEPDDGPAVAREIVKFTKTLERDDEFGIEFVQIGRDANATKFLQSLDNDLQKQGAKFDIVNTKTLEEVEKAGLEQTLIDALDS